MTNKKNGFKRLNPTALLFIAAIFAVIFANTPIRDIYFSLMDKPVSLSIGNFNLFSHHGQPMSFSALVNDALMVIFFFVIGLDIKQEFIVGELSTPKKAILPIVAAIGGMVVPVLLFFLVVHEYPMYRGAAIPMATDIAFALSVLTLLGDDTSEEAVHRIVLMIAPTKNIARMEWLVEKAVEIGVKEIHFFHSKHSERKTLNMDRLQRIAVAAMKQSERSYLPILVGLRNYEETLSTNEENIKCIASCSDEFHKQEFISLLAQADKTCTISIVIGPEGDFSKEEMDYAVACGYQPVSLGSIRLRTETAGLLAVSAVRILDFV